MMGHRSIIVVMQLTRNQSGFSPLSIIISKKSNLIISNFHLPSKKEGVGSRKIVNVRFPMVLA
jgi:hypothetical protein